MQELTFGFFIVCLSAEMKNLLKYILITILGLALYSSSKEDSSSREYEIHNILQAENLLEQEAFVSSARTDICPPRPVSTLSVPRVQHSSRHDSSNRHNSEFAKFGKTISSGHNYIAHNTTLIQHSPFIDPGHKLTRLCRFII